MTRFAVLAAMAVALLSPARAGWGDAKLWNDGRAEVAVYDAERVTYGKPRSFREQILIVKEDLRADTLVKADQPKAQKTIRVFKMNQVQKFDTENYPYSILTTVFAPVKEPGRPLKITVGSQEWCGNTFKILTARDPASASLTWYSYFDGEADQTVTLPLGPGDVFEDQLPLALRALPLAAGFSTEIRLWDSLASNRGVEPRVSTAVVTVAGEEIVRCRAGSLPSWKVTVSRPDSTDVYWFEKAAPGILTRMETSDGRKRLLYGRVRWSYWDRRFPQPNVLK